MGGGKMSEMAAILMLAGEGPDWVIQLELLKRWERCFGFHSLIFLSSLQCSDLHVWRQAADQTASAGPGSVDGAFTGSRGCLGVIF